METTYTSEMTAAKEIAELLTKINDSGDKKIAKATIKSFLEGFIARDRLDDKPA